MPVHLACRLSDAFLQDDKLSATAVLVFMLSPASIHHCMAYTEALFTAASWLGLYCLYCRGSSSTAALAFALSSAARSNGMHLMLSWPLDWCSMCPVLTRVQAGPA